MLNKITERSGRREELIAGCFGSNVITKALKMQWDTNCWDRNPWAKVS